jgi:hypothetical protein
VREPFVALVIFFVGLAADLKALQTAERGLASDPELNNSGSAMTASDSNFKAFH